MEWDAKKMLKLDFISSIKGKNLRFTSRPQEEITMSQTKKIDQPVDSFVNLHMEVARKVDALIVENENKKNDEIKNIFTTSTGDKSPLRRLIKLR